MARPQSSDWSLVLCYGLHVSVQLSCCIARTDCRQQCATLRYSISKKPTVHLKRQPSPLTAV
eukprot:8880727-Pyramimonas_sp.AAC.1